MKIYYIYKITNTINNKIYIGQTCQKNPMNRCYAHFKQARNNDPGPLYRSIRKYGREFFNFELLLCCSNLELCNEMEIFLIKFYKSKTNENGYNIMDGGNQYNPTEEYKQNLSRILKEIYKTKKPWNLGMSKPEHLKYKRPSRATGKRKTNPLNQVICINTGQIFESASDAARYYNTSPSRISAVCRNERPHYTGLVFQFCNRNSYLYKFNNCR